MAQNATLIISQPGHRTQRLELMGGVASIGRAAGNAVCLKDDSSVSRYHAVIADRGDGFWLTDLGTRNGTTVNNDPVASEKQLNDGDLICVGGGSTIEFCWPVTDEKEAEESPGSSAAAPTPVSVEESPARQKSPADEDSAAPADKQSSSETTREPSSGRTLGIVVGLVGGLAVTTLLVGILFATGIVGAQKSRPANSSISETRPTVDDPPEPTPEPTATVEVKDVSGGEAAPTPNATPNNGTESLVAAAQVLAAKISPKNYNIDPAFAALIGSYVEEYRRAPGYYGRARKYRDAIDKEFVNTQGLPPLFGYVMAMSRSKFEEGNGGIWQLPAPLVKGEVAGVEGPDTPAGSTKVAASYMRGLWDIFGREGFMYAVACYGMTADQAGEVQQQLELKDPSGEARYDFWRMKNAGVVKGDQVERVARFFAAGIVAERPQQFGLKEQPLSTLVD
jgi:pSer/pThr/pTyr-binding forkhead associated (FHA) protein